MKTLISVLFMAFTLNSQAKLTGDPVLECMTPDTEESFYLYMANNEEKFIFNKIDGFGSVSLSHLSYLTGTLTDTNIDLSFDEFGIGSASIKGSKKSQDPYFNNVIFNYRNIKDRNMIPKPKPIENLEIKCMILP